MEKRNQRNVRNKHKKRKLVVKDKKAFVRSVSILLIVIVLCVAVIAARKTIGAYLTSLVSPNNVVSENIDDSSDAKDTKAKPENATFTMAVTGDIMCHNTQYKDAYNASTGTYDFSYVFEDVKYYIQTADIAVGNLETTFAGSEVRIQQLPYF